ncbi:MAG TPA: SHOCT domain-containing protein [Jatrophihabitans sp.]|nr:SHOCT domain-containing protein [Jatrophihabitans sp.]
MGTAASSYPFLDAMWTMIVFFGWVLWIWLLITVYMDLFRRRDIGGWGKTGWIIFTILLPFIGVFVYLIAEGRAMESRRREDARAAQAEMDSYVRSVAKTGGSADQIAQAKQLLDTGAITPDEYQALKQKALAA